MAEKSEKATPKKLRDARKKGQVAKSQDFPGAFTFMVSILTTLALIDYLYDKIGGFTTAAFSSITAPNLTQLLGNFFYEAILLIFICAAPIVGLTALCGMVATFLAVGPTWAPEVFKPDIKKFNPVTNLKNKFKIKTLVELLKQIFKITVAGWLIWGVVWKSIPVLSNTVDLPLPVALSVLYYFLREVVIKVGIFFIVVAIADLIYQKHQFTKEMKMEKFEVKQEYKNTEGDPQIKGRRRQLAQEIAYQEGPAYAVKKAQAIVTNPTHLAIAVGYERELDAAPYILTMGKDHLAEHIINLAEEYGVPILRNIPLAHKLWEEGEIYEYVPEDAYEALAEILRWVASLQQSDTRY